MLVDRRKDTYDELMMLSRDARVSKSKRTAWSTGIVATVAAVSGLYVAGSNQHIQDLAEARQAAQKELDTVKAQLASLQAEHDYTMRNQDWLRDLAIALSDKPEVINNLGRVGPDPTPEGQLAMRNLVWIVDGSRRFPMAAGDILWVPEGEFWIRLENPEGSRPKPHKYSIYSGTSPGVGNAELVVDHPDDPEGPGYIGYFQRQIVAADGRGVTSCIRLTLHEDSVREGFQSTDYVDMEVLYYPRRILTADNKAKM
jgi:hypothetical protein